jgi:hypothetical protein
MLTLVGSPNSSMGEKRTMFGAPRKKKKMITATMMKFYSRVKILSHKL